MKGLFVDKISNWIYVTGAPRSGTTFVGLNLSIPKEVDYIHEPFNPMCGMANISQWHRYYRSDLLNPESRNFYDTVYKLFTYDFNLKSHVPKRDPLMRQLTKRLVGSRGPFNLRLAKVNPFHNSAVIKDPIGCFLAEFLFVNFKVKPLLIVKHPISFVASLKRVGFNISRSQFGDQSHLIEDYFSEEPDYLMRPVDSPILEAAYFWRAVYKVLLVQSRRYPEWKVITHENLSDNPIEIFQDLYDSFDLPWSNKVMEKIKRQTQVTSSSEARKGRIQDFNRNSSGIFDMRRRSLTLEERREIFEIVKDVALQVYSEESFLLN